MTPELVVPAVAGLLGAVVGALGALGGSWLQNRHDSEQRKLERAMSLRRDVYLEAAEGLAGFPQYLVGLANADIPVKSLEPLLNARPGWQNKLHVIASLETIEAFAKADALFIRTSMDLAPMRYRVDEVGRLVAQETNHRAQVAQYQSALHTAMQAQLPVEHDQQKLLLVQSIRAEIDKAQAEIVASFQREAALHGERAELIKTLLEKAIARVAEHRLLLARANLAVRREIDAAVDEERYLALNRSMNQDVLEAFAKLVGTLESGDAESDS